MIKTHSPITAPVDNSFLKPFSRDVLRQDILNVCMLHARLSYLFADVKTTAKAHFRRDVVVPVGLSYPDETPQDIGLTYDDVRWTDFAQAMERQYNYAFEAVIGGPGEPMENETSHTAVAAILLDMQESMLVYELSSYGGGYWEASVQRCLHVTQLANARLLLESGAVFTYLRAANGRDQNDASHEGLTVKQMALLAGMEEMSIRTAASRKGPSTLTPRKDGARTVFDRGVAKQWLIDKGRYLPVRRIEAASPDDLMARNYSSTGEFLEMVQSIVDTSAFDRSTFHLTVYGAGFDSLAHMQAEDLKNSTLMGEIAEALHLPPQIFILRAREAAIRDELKALEAKTKELLSQLPTD
ncbi:hypothetical protein [Hydrogenophaga sp. R2]|uniref:hypothetical protein n=1 Tax=Hydrogenophaga sp. R2 TaxID=3132827 RepID=UPI003CF42FF9